MTISTTSSTESRALELLGQGLAPAIVASATGITVSRISQLLSDENFSEKVRELKYFSLAKNTKRDQKIDELEDRTLEMLEKQLSMVYDPMKLVHIHSRLNAARRRGITSPDVGASIQPTAQISLPTVLINNFITNINNQIVRAGEKDLLTIQSSALDSLLEKQPNVLLTDASFTETAHPPRGEGAPNSG